MTNNLRSSRPLTDREQQVLEHMALGKTNGQIGRALYLSEDTVKTHARRLFGKLGGVETRVEAVIVALRRRLITLDGIPVDPPGGVPTDRAELCHPHRDTSRSVRLVADDHDAALLSSAMFGPTPTDPALALRRSRQAIERLVHGGTG